jgi:hypothetical protein
MTFHFHHFYYTFYLSLSPSMLGLHFNPEDEISRFLRNARNDLTTQRTASKMAHAGTLLTCSWDVPDSNPG